MKAKIYKPAKTAMQSGRAKYNKWVLKFSDKKNQLKEYCQKLEPFLIPQFKLML